MTEFAVQPRDPLVLRDGRPNDGRSESRTVPFPFPSTLAGVVRTALGRQKGEFQRELIPALLEKVAMRGPLLQGPGGWFVPAPRDALVVRNPAGELLLQVLRPIELPQGAATSATHTGGRLVGLPATEHVKAKPVSAAPAFWPWVAFEEWLRAPSRRDHDRVGNLLSEALVGLTRDERIHVALSELGTARDGMLFGTEGLAFVAHRFDARSTTEKADGKPPPSAEHELELWVDVEIGNVGLGAVEDGLRPLGGERRLTSWRARTESSVPALPDWLEQHVATSEPAMVRVILLTPAYVDSSRGPVALAEPGVSSLVAAKVDRPITISGWDLATGKHGQPKKTRRLAAAGSVFWVELSGTAPERRAWLERVWMRNVSDDPQLARDGFGLAAIGVGRAP